MERPYLVQLAANRLEGDANIDPEGEKWSLCVLHAWAGDSAEVISLLEAMQNPNYIRDNSWMTVMEFMISAKHMQAVEALLNLCPDLYPEHHACNMRRCATLAAKHDWPEGFQVIIDNAPLLDIELLLGITEALPNDHCTQVLNALTL